MSAFASLNIGAVNKAGPLAFETSGVADSLKVAIASNDAAVANEGKFSFHFVD